jgi:signal peptidase II
VAARSKLAATAAVAAGVVAADQLAKAVVRGVGDRLPWMLTDGVGIDPAYNSGVSFGRLKDAGDVLIVLVVVLVLVLGFLVVRLPRRFTVPLALIVGGALGNLIDRVRWGSVLDYVAAGPWPTFNVADIAIVVGAVLVGWRVLRAPPGSGDD